MKYAHGSMISQEKYTNVPNPTKAILATIPNKPRAMKPLALILASSCIS
jgi:hypothetical protein